MTIVIPEGIARRIRRVAEELGVTPEEYVLDALTKGLDPGEGAREYVEAARSLIAQAEEGLRCVCLSPAQGGVGGVFHEACWGLSVAWGREWSGEGWGLRGLRAVFSVGLTLSFNRVGSTVFAGVVLWRGIGLGCIGRA